MRILCFLAAGLIYSSFGYANANNNSEAVAEIQQDRVTVQGRVVDAKGDPLAGVTVIVSGTTTAALTDVNGAYNITVPSGSTLTYQFLGYSTQARAVGTRGVINVTLEEDSKTLDQVVVVGYGSQKLTNVTGALFPVDVNKTLASRPISDIGRGLQGSVPGLSVAVRSGEVGSDPQMVIRGAYGSYTGNTNPLILVDNVEIPSMQVVNPNDVESITVLKDAASTSIYGSKSAYGVILITTKKGSAREKISVNYTGNFSWQNRFKPLEMGGIDGLQYVWDAAQTRDPKTKPTTNVGFGMRFNQESIEKSKEWVEKYGKTGLVKPGDPYVYGRDWYRDPQNGQNIGIRIFEPADALVAEWAPTMNHNLTLNGRSGKTSFNLGLGLLDQSGMVKNAVDDFKRYSGTLKLSTEVNKFLTVRAGAMYSDRIKRSPSTYSYASDPWLYAYRWSSLMPIGVTDQSGDPLRNPAYELANATTDKRRNVYSNFNLGATVNFTRNWNLEFDYTFVTEEAITERSYPRFTYRSPWLLCVPMLDANGEPVYVDEEGNITTEGGMEAYQFPWDTYPTIDPADADGVFPPDDKAYVSRASTRYNTHTINAYTTYNLSLGERHTFKFMAGINTNAYHYKGHTARLGGLYDFENPQFSFTNNGQHTASGADYWDSLLGFFGRINYAFADKYLFEANLRFDGTSKFPKELWWATFPSFSVGWVISHENFFKPIDRVVNFAKIRASWGSVGDERVSNDIYLRTMSRLKGSWLNSAGQGIYTNNTPSAAQSDVRWQRVENMDFGVDFEFLQGKLGLTFDWFQRHTKDMIIPGDALPSTYGASAPRGNYGNQRARGWEVTLTYNHRFQNGLGISALATFWDSQTIVTKGPDFRTEWANRKISDGWATGQRRGDIWGYVTDRLYQEEDFIRGTDGNFETTYIIINGNGRTTHKLTGDNPVYQSYLEDGGGVVIFRPGDVKYVDINGDGYITPGEGTFGDPGDRKVIGNSLPRYEYGFRLGLDYKGFDLSVFIQGVGSRQLWGDGQLTIPGYNLGDGAVPKAFAIDYWTPERTDAFYPRPWNMGLYPGDYPASYSMQVQTKYLLNMAYTRIKNITFGYSVPARLLKKAYIEKARVYVSLENFFTFDNLRGLPVDPEVVPGYSMFSNTNYNSNRVGMGTPMFKSASVGIELGF